MMNFLKLAVSFVTVAAATMALALVVLLWKDVQDLKELGVMQTCIVTSLTIERSWEHGELVPTDTLDAMFDLCGYIPGRRGTTL